MSELDTETVSDVNANLAHLVRSTPAVGHYQVGDSVPDFSLANVSGEDCSLFSRIERGPVVLKFFSGLLNPYCQLELKTLTSRLPEINRMGFSIIGILPGPCEHKNLTGGARAKNIELLCDTDYQVARRFSLDTRLDNKGLAESRDSGLNLLTGQPFGSDVIHLPATYVINRDGIICLVYGNPDFRQRLELSDMMSVLRILI